MGLRRRLAALVALLGLTLGAALFLAPGAVAGGPTSVLIVSPESGEATALYASAPEYGQLSSLLRAGSTGGKDRPPGLDSVTGVRQINVTWMAHDISPWRLDRVYPSDDARTVWVHSAAGLPESYDGVWHKAAKPAELTRLLTSLGVMGEKSTELGGPGMPPHSSWQDGGTATPPPAASAGSTESTGSTDWWWAIPGLAVGLALGLALRPLAARLVAHPLSGPRGRERDEGPRRQLLDL
ncbi:hypothetical protein ABZ729_25885 [Streptomyces sp. NPDC006678]|uniref:hypothetical protein n=1 Tax=Streptomyces sp. NPDC006678 TaxID=3157185 RepID=UPI0033E10227